MREFSQEERNFIVDNETKMPLGKLAEYFGCSWKEIYNVYSEEILKPEYRLKADRRRAEKAEEIRRYRERKKQKAKERMGKEHGENRQENSGNEEKNIGGNSNSSGSSNI